MKFLQNDISVLTKEQKEEISNFMINNNEKNFEINNDFQIKSLDNLSTEEFISFSKTKSFVLINQKSYELMKDKNQTKNSPINYQMQNNKIKFMFRNFNFEFFINDNIIFSNLDLNYLIIIKLFSFNEDFKNKINEKKINTFIMIDKDLISKIKHNLNYDIFYNHMKKLNINFKENNKVIDNKNIFKIIKSLPKDYINSINTTFDLNQINYDKKIINEKEIGDGQNLKILKYINNFEIIDINLSVMLSRIKKDIKNLFDYGRFYFLKNKILIVFQDNVTKLFYFEIGYINELNIFVVEYLINIDDYDNQCDRLMNFDKYFNEFNSDIILKGIYENEVTNTFLLENKICYFYKLFENGNKDNNIFNFNSINGNKTQFYVDKFIKPKNENKNENIKFYLELLINFYKIDKQIQSIKNNYNIEEEFYILNENWVKQFKSIFNYNEILTKEIKDLINDNDFNSDIADEIIKKLPENIIFNLNLIKESNSINKYLNYIDAYKTNSMPNYHDDYNKMTLLNYNFGLINNEIFKSFENNKININKDALEKVNCLFLNNRIILYFERKDNCTINIGFYKDNLFFTEIIIISKNYNNIKTIIDLFKTNGYNEYMKYLLFENDIFNIKENNIKIIKISKDIDKYNYKKSLISERLKAFISLSIYQQNVIKKTQKSYDKESDEVVLIKYNWLEAFGYEKINEIVNNNIHNNYISNLFLDDIESFNNFILSLDKKEIKDIDETLKQIDINFDDILVNLKSIQFPNNKKVFYYNDFMVINKKISKLLFGSFNIYKNHEFFKFLSVYK